MKVSSLRYLTDVGYEWKKKDPTYTVIPRMATDAFQWKMVNDSNSNFEANWFNILANFAAFMPGNFKSFKIAQ